MSAIERELIDRIAKARRFKPPMPSALMNVEQRAQVKIDRARHREEQLKNAPTIDAGLFGNHQKVEHRLTSNTRPHGAVASWLAT